MSFYRNAAGLLVTSAVSMPIGFATSVVLARFLTPEDRGAYALVLAFTMLVSYLAQLGWPGAAVYRLRRIRADHAEVMSSSLLFLALMSLLAVAACLLLEPWLRASVLRGTSSEAFVLAAALVPFVMVGVVMDSVARGIDRFAVGNWSRLGVVVLTLLAALAVLVARPGGLVEILEATLAVHVVVAAAIILALLRLTGASLRIDVSGVRDSLRFGLKNYGTGLAEKLRERTELFLLAFFLDPAQVAFFAIAANLIARLKTVTEALGQAAFPELAGLDAERAATFASTVSRQSLLWVFGAALLLGASAPLLVPLLFGEPYRASVAPVLILLPAAALTTVYRVLFRYFMAVDMQRFNLIAQNAALAVSVGANLLLIPRFGVTGAALASLCSAAVESGVVIVAFRLQSGLGPSALFVPRRSDVEAFTSRAARLARRVLLTPEPVHEPED